ncbi:MAG: site-specific integrase [Thermodesulfobacteriota bacterium]
MGKLKNKMLQRMVLKNFSKRTIQIYLFHMKRFVAHNGKSPDLLGKEEIEEYLYLLYKQKASSSGIAQAYSALKFFYYDCLERPWELDKIPRPKPEKRLPIILSANEVKAILQNVGNIKHQMVLMIIYSAGLRLAEALHIKVKDIDSSRMQIRVEQGKGKRDRYTLLSIKLLKRLREYYKIYKPQYWLFPGRDEKPLCSSTIQRAFHNAKKKQGYQKKQQSTHYAIALQPIY